MISSYIIFPTKAREDFSAQNPARNVKIHYCADRGCNTWHGNCQGQGGIFLGPNGHGRAVQSGSQQDNEINYYITAEDGGWVRVDAGQYAREEFLQGPVAEGSQNPRFRMVAAYSVAEQNFQPEYIFWPRSHSVMYFCPTLEISQQIDSMIVSDAPNAEPQTVYIQQQKTCDEFGWLLLPVLGVGAFFSMKILFNGGRSEGRSDNGVNGMWTNSFTGQTRSQTYIDAQTKIAENQKAAKASEEERMNYPHL